MLNDLKTYCMAFIHLIQGNPQRKSADFNFELNEIYYNPSGLHAVYKDTRGEQLYDIIITSRLKGGNGDHRFLPETL